MTAGQAVGTAGGTRSSAPLVMAWMFLFGMVTVGLIGPNRTAIEQDYGLTHGAFGLLVGVAPVLCAGAVLLFARRLQRIGSLRLLAAALVAQAAGFAVVWAWASAVGFAVGWGLVQVGVTLGAVTNNVSADLWPGNPRRGVVLLHGVNAAGKVAGPLVAIACLAAGWRLGFAAYAVLCTALFVMFAVRRSVGPGARPGQPEGPPARIRPALFWQCILPFGLIAGADQAIATLLPTYAELHAGLARETAGLMLTVHLLGIAVGRFVCVPLDGRVSNNAVIGTCLAFGLAVLPALQTKDPVMLGVCGFLLGGMYSAVWPAYYAQIAHNFAGARTLLDFGSMFGTTVGVSACIAVSSAVADVSLPAALTVGPLVMAAFGLVYYTSHLSRAPERARPAAEQVVTDPAGGA